MQVFFSPQLVKVLHLYFQDMKKLQGQLVAEQEVLYGSKSPSKPQSARKAPRTPSGSAGSRRGTFGGSMLKPDSKLTRSSSTRKTDRVHQIEDDGISCLSSGIFLYTSLPFCFLFASPPCRFLTW
jgi:hypothetical protein